MGLLSRLAELAGFVDFQGGPPVESETLTTVKRNSETQRWGIPCKVLPNDLICATRDPRLHTRIKSVSGDWEIGREAVHIRLVIDLLEFALDHAGERFLIREVYAAFRGHYLVTWHEIIRIAQRLEKAGVLVRPVGGNRGRVVDVDRCFDLLQLADEWIESEPEYRLTVDGEI